MNPLPSIFGAGVRLRNALYDRGTFRSQSLQGPVVSVGNLSLGGSGKTPFVLTLGERLQARGISFDILSRGYGRRTRGVALVDPNGTLTVSTATVTGFAAGPVASPFNTVINNISATTPLAGTYTVLGPTSTLSIPSISATTYQDLSSVLPGLWAQVTVSGNVVASAVVPEPSTIALAGFGLVGLALAAYRRNRK